MNLVTIIWVALPFLIGFTIYLLPKLDRWLAFLTAFASAAFALLLLAQQSPLTLQLIDSFGVTLMVDPLSGFFILTNALVTAAVVIYCWDSGKTAFFYAQLAIVHGSINATFACIDFVSLYVALEVSGIAAFLLIAYPRTDRTLWVALRYLFVSNTSMLFYLVGVALAYQANHSFAFDALRGAPPEATALIFMGLVVKGGVFISGSWLPLTHSESETPVSALLSGVVVKAGVYPLVRCALIIGEVDPIVRLFGVGTAVLGVFYAIFERDTKRLLAYSTISQLGYILAAPAVGGFYALSHGLVKSCLFLLAGALPSRNFKELQQKPMPTAIWMALVVASLSIAGFPFLAGFGAKTLALANLLPWQQIVMNVAAVGTVIAYSKFVFLPHGNAAEGAEPPKVLPAGFWTAVVLLLSELVIANLIYLEAYTVDKVLKALAIVAIGALLYWLFFRRADLKLSRQFEQFDHLTGAMILILIPLFWMAFSWVKYV